MRHRLAKQGAAALAGVTAGLLLLFISAEALAGGLVRAPAVGGVYIDAEGVVSAPPTEGTEALRAAWQAGLQQTPADLKPLADLRFVSLRRLNDRLAESMANGEPLADELRYVAGLLRVKHVLVYPPADGKPGDIVLAGPAEGWRVDALGNTVGETTGRPVLMLDDLVVALRAGESSNGAGISCSIDPTTEGLARAQQVEGRLRAEDGPQTAARKLEQALGRQKISIGGVPASSHFARTLVAADFRMKRLAMGFEPAPIGGLPSYLETVNARRASSNLLPRWWLAADYEPLARDAEGLAWEVRGRGVKCLAEEDFVDAAGKITRGDSKGASNAAAWADKLTERFDELADHDSAFGQVRNAFDLSVVAALLELQDLWNVAGLKATALMSDYEPEEYSVPRHVATQATFLKRGSRWVITASGGVQVFPWQVADRDEEQASLAQLRTEQAQPAGQRWWWQ